MATIQVLISRRADSASVQVVGLLSASEAQRERRIHAWTRHLDVPVPAAHTEREALRAALVGLVEALGDDL